MRLQALRAGAVELLPKPFDDELLVESVRAASIVESRSKVNESQEVYRGTI